MKNLILLAVQGAGKGTVAQALVEDYGHVHISTGQILRGRREQNDEIAKTIAECQDTGVLVPNKIVYQVFEERLVKPDCQNYILDGFPRNLEQAKECDKILTKLNKDDYLVINLTVPADILIARIVSRRSCDKCGKIYNLDFAPMRPRIDGKCDDCDGNLTQRNDDSDPDAIRQRIEIYHENAADLINYYQTKGVLVDVDSTETQNAIQAIKKLLWLRLNLKPKLIKLRYQVI